MRGNFNFSGAIVERAKVAANNYISSFLLVTCEQN